MTIAVEKVLYTAKATAQGGRDGKVASNDGKLDVVVAPPAEMGGNGKGTNPEQLFAAGYALAVGLLLVAFRDVHGAALVGGFAIDGAGRQGARGLPVLERHPRQPEGRPADRLSVAPEPLGILTVPGAQSILARASFSSVSVCDTGAAAIVSASMMATYSSTSSSLSR